MALADVVTHVRRIVQDEPYQGRTTALSTKASPTFVVAVNDGDAWAEGDTMEFPSDGGQGLVESVSADNVTVVPDHNNTTMAATYASGSLVQKNPRFGTIQIQQAITHVLDYETWPEVWQFKVTTLTPSPTTTVLYDLPADYEGFVDLVQVASGTIEDIVRVHQVEELPNTPTGISTTLKSLRIRSFPRNDVNATLTYRAKISSSGIPADYEPIAAWGAVLRLLLTEAIEKADRRDEQDRNLRLLRTRRVAAEYERLKSAYRSTLLARWGPVRRFRRRPRGVTGG